MEEIFFVSPYIPETLSSLKIAALYFDKIILQQNLVYQVVPVDKSKKELNPGDIGIIKDIVHFIDDRFIDTVRPLCNEGLLEIRNYEARNNIVDEEKERAIRSHVEELLAQRQDLLMREIDVQKAQNGRVIQKKLNITEEVKGVHEKYVGPLQPGKVFSLGFINKYYGSLLIDTQIGMAEGKATITGSPVVGDFLKYIYQNERYDEFKQSLLTSTGLKPHIAFDLLKLAVPDVSSLSLEEILEIKRQLKDELLKFQAELGQVSHNVIHEYDQEDLLKNLQEIVRYRVLPSVAELEAKIKQSNLRPLKNLTEALKKPESYVPFIGTIFHQIPAQLAFLLSLGLMSFETAIKYFTERKRIVNNGLYYVIQLKKKTQNIT
jgi:hypothetical protein